MAALSHRQCLIKLRSMYRDAYKCDAADTQAVLDWAANPYTWATWQIRQFGWSYLATEAVVRQCRILHKRAVIASLMEEVPDA
jgi:hypothetical protein